MSEKIEVNTMVFLSKNITTGKLQGKYYTHGTVGRFRGKLGRVTKINQRFNKGALQIQLVHDDYTYPEIIDDVPVEQVKNANDKDIADYYENEATQRQQAAETRELQEDETEYFRYLGSINPHPPDPPQDNYLSPWAHHAAARNQYMGGRSNSHGRVRSSLFRSPS